MCAVEFRGEPPSFIKLRKYPIRFGKSVAHPAVQITKALLEE